MTRQRARVLLIGGTDSSGGAGLARDIRVCAECSVEIAVAVTAVTAQTDEVVRVVHPVPPAVIRAQIETALGRPVGAVKIGMLGTAASVETVVQGLQGLRDLPVVVDPVLVASSGGRLLDAPGLDALLSLLPLATLLTPNILEAAALLGGEPATNEEECAGQARRIRCLGVANVLVKGGHAQGSEAVDVLVDSHDRVHRFASSRIATCLRGTGCALAAFIAAQLAVGVPVETACRAGKAALQRRFDDALAGRAGSPAMRSSRRGAVMDSNTTNLL